MLWEEGELATSATFCAPNRPGSSVEKQWQDFAREARNPRLERISEIQICGLVIGGPVPSPRKSDAHNAISWQNTSEKDLEVSFKMKHFPTLQPNDSTSRILLQRNESVFYTKPCTQMFSIALFIMGPNWRQH